MRKYTFLLLSLFIITACTKDNAKMSDAAGKGGSMARFAISGNYLYVANSYLLKVFDITDPAAPVDKGFTHLQWGIETIFAYDQKLFIGSVNALYIFDITDPARPKQESRVQHFRSCDPVVTAGTTAYVTLRGGNSCGGILNQLLTFDVNDPKNPLQKSQFNLMGPYGLGVQDSALYVCDGPKGLAVFNIKEPQQPKFMEYIEDGNTYYDVIPYHGILIAYVKNGVRFFDISKPQKPVALSAIMN